MRTYTILMSDKTTREVAASRVEVADGVLSCYEKLGAFSLERLVLVVSAGWWVSVVKQ